MADTPKHTTRLAIPYPPENGEDWWAIENGANGRMDRIDQCIYAAMENPTLHWDRSSGHWDYNSGSGEFEVGLGTVIVKSPAGGRISFNSVSIPIEDDEYLYIEIPERPVTGTAHTGVLGVTASYLEQPGRCIVGYRRGSGFNWLRPLLESFVD